MLHKLIVEQVHAVDYGNDILGFQQYPGLQKGHPVAQVIILDVLYHHFQFLILYLPLFAHFAI